VAAWVAFQTAGYSMSTAVKFTPDGGRVELSARRGDGEVHVAVRDTGVGIGADDLPRVFDEFRQVGQATAKAEGTGLGLPLAKRFSSTHLTRSRQCPGRMPPLTRRIAEVTAAPSSLSRSTPMPAD